MQHDENFNICHRVKDLKNNVTISLTSIQWQDGEKTQTELVTKARQSQLNGCDIIAYDDTEATGFEGSSTCVKVWDNGASITRFGRHKSCLMIEKGITNLCNYDTPAGSLVLDINGVEVTNNLSEKGGDINLSYTLNAGGLLISENSIKMNIREL